MRQPWQTTTPFRRDDGDLRSVLRGRCMAVVDRGRFGNPETVHCRRRAIFDVGFPACDEHTAESLVYLWELEDEIVRCAHLGRDPE